MKYKLGIDCDGTLYESWGRATAYAEEKTGQKAKPWTNYDSLREQYGEQLANEAFQHACGPETMHTREVYPQVVQAMNDLHYMDIDLVVVTHNHDPDAQYAPLRDWLEDNVFGAVPFKLCVLRHDESKLDFIRVAKMFGLIDDKPSIITEVGRAGLFAASKKHDYTSELLWEPSVRVFEDWGDVPYLVWRWLKYR